MDQTLRNKLRNVVTQCRKLLEEAVSQVLQGQFGIYASGKKDEVHVEDEARMKNLSEEDKGYRRDIQAHLEHIEALGYKAKDSLAQLVREIAFTHLNRLCAYKMMEARAVWIGGKPFRESVSRGIKSQGFQFYLADHPEDKHRFDTGHQDVAYRHFLGWLGALLSEEIGVLFSPTDPANRLFLPQRVLDEVLALLNSDDLKDIWAVDETIGWVYQYFTPKELRDKARKESQAPRNSYELAFRNQFFTPRYVVEFLTDNTLGRIWYEIRKGDTKLKDQCHYMVRRPSEVFLAEGQSPPEPTQNQDDLSQEELLKQPVHIPHRPKKDPRELRILDPACGSGHFLLYCFALLLTIYEEAYADPDLGPKLKVGYPTLDALLRDVPRLILAHNLHGIDIDLRATQIAALALWLRCQRAYQEMGLKQDRPKITKSNIVCAEPMPGESEMLKEFVAELQPKVLGHLVEIVFDKMTLAGEAGSLLKIEEELRDAIGEAKKQWAAEHEQATDRKGRPLLFSRAEMERLANKTPEPQLFDFSEITDEQFWNEAESQVLAALRSYAAHASSGGTLQRQLFVEDAAQGFAFIDLCQKRFDVVLMNPPFGDPSHPSRKKLEEEYDHLSNEITVTFMQRSVDLLGLGGVFGVLSPRNVLFLDSLSDFRSAYLFARCPLTYVVDAGFGVLDEAMIETGFLVCSVGPALSSTWVARNLDCPPQQKGPRLFDQATTHANTYLCDVRSFQLTPNKSFAYWATARLLKVLKAGPYLDSAAEGKWGLFTADNDRFLRLWWEPKPASGWVPYYKGGVFRRFVYDADAAVNWSDRGAAIRSNVDNKGRQRSRIPNPEYYFRAGLTFPNVTFKGLAVRALPKGAIFSLRGPALFPKNPDDLHWLLAYLNSRCAEVFVVMQAATRRWELAQVTRIPLPHFSKESRSDLALLANRASDLMQEELRWNETSHYFVGLPIGSRSAESLSSAFQGLQKRSEEIRKRCESILEEIEAIVERAYGLSEEDRACIDAFTGYTGVAKDQDQDGEEDDDEVQSHISLQEIARQLASYCFGVCVGRWSICSTPPTAESVVTDPFECLPEIPPGACGDGRGRFADQDGIIPDDPDHSDDMIHRVQEVLELIWKDRAEGIEKEACEVLGVKELRDYFRKPGKGGFWDDHVSRYSKSRRKAPIYWLLQSSKKNYALWLYYHRLDKDVLFKARQKYVDPKIRLEQTRLDSLRSQKTALSAAAKGAKKTDKDIERQETLLGELKDFAEKLERAAKLTFGNGEKLNSDVMYDPDLNDGVVLNIAPLWELVPWKEAKNYWEELLEGKYEWSSMGKLLRKKGLVK